MSEIIEIEARLRAATPGPWQLYEGGWVVSIKDGDGKQMFVGSSGPINEARLIANAPTDIRRLIEELRQQQEREAGLLAQIEALREALELYADLDNWGVEVDGRQGFRRWIGGGDGTEIADETLSLTPPQALVQQQERIAKLEAVAEAADTYRERPFVDECRRACCDHDAEIKCVALADALYALDAKGGEA